MDRNTTRSYLSLAAASSWPSFWTLGALNLVIALFPGFDSLLPFWYRWLAVGAGHLMMFTVLAVGRRCEEKWRPKDIGLGATLGIFVISSLARICVVNLVLRDADVWRSASGFVMALVLLILTTILVSVWRAYQEERRRLEVQNAQLAATAKDVDVEIIDRNMRTLSIIEETLVSELSRDSATIDADSLERLAHEVVRPLSHQLAEQTPSWSVPPSGDTPNKVKFRDVLDTASRGRPFLPVATATALLAFGFLPVLAAVGPTLTLVYCLIGFASLVLLIALANRVLAQILSHRSLRMRASVVVIVALLLGLTVAGISTIVTTVSGVVVVTEPAIRIALSVLVAVFAWILAVAKGTVAALREVLHRLELTQAKLAWRVARLRQGQWTRQRSLARLLHGPLQTVLVKNAQQLRTNSSPTDPDFIVGLQAEITDLLTGVTADQDETTWTDGISRIQSTWDGVVDVTVHEDVDAVAALAADVVGTSVCIEVASQAVANAVRHGHATTVSLRLLSGERDVQLSISDDGVSEPSATIGMGTQVLMDCSTYWSRHSSKNGTLLEAHIPVARNATS